MGTYNIHAGHCPSGGGACGAVGYLNESDEARKVKNRTIATLRGAGNTVYDCTDDSRCSEGQNLANIVNKCNSHLVNLDVSIHLNAGRGVGVEVWCYDGGTQAVASRICANIANALGIPNRGVKYTQNYYVLNNTKSPAILIECCFVDSTDYLKWDAVKCGDAIASGIVGHAIASQPTAPKQVFRIRKSKDDAKSQCGAYSKKASAIAMCPLGYAVYDINGNEVYSNRPSLAVEWYRVRKSWDDVKSQRGAYQIKTNAISNCPDGYKVFDSKGVVIYPTATATPTPTPAIPKPEEPAKPTIDALPEISELKGLGNKEFIEKLGAKATADMKLTGILASVTVAQGILESSWGQSDLSLKANNLFGMKAGLSGNNWGSEWVGATVTKNSPEEKNGVVSMVLSTFRKFDSIDECIKDHSKYLSCAMNGAVLRYDGIIGERDYRKAITIAKNGGYATDSGYVDKICGLIEQYELTRFDKLDEVEENPTAPPVEDADESVNVSTITSVLEKILELLQKLVDFITRK